MMISARSQNVLEQPPCRALLGLGCRLRSRRSCLRLGGCSRDVVEGRPEVVDGAGGCAVLGVGVGGCGRRIALGLGAGDGVGEFLLLTWAPLARIGGRQWVVLQEEGVA